MNKTIRVGLTAASFALANVFASAQSTSGSVQVTVDGNPVNFQAAQPQTLGGRVLVPLRGVFEQLGANVDWDPDTQTVMIDGAGRHIRLQVGSFDATVNGRVVTMDTKPELIDDSTMVPLRFLSQSLGARVDWEPEQNLVAISSISRAQRFNPPPAPTPPPPAPIIVNTPPPPPVIVPPPTIIVRQEAPPPPPPPAPEMFTITRDNVLPMRLDVEVTSDHSKSGDAFVASVRDVGAYWDFPEGTVVEGFIRSSTPATGSHGGTLDLRFTHIRFPDGHRYRITGAVVPLDSKYVIRTREGRYIARSGRDYAIAQDTNPEDGAGLAIGAYPGMAVGGSALGGSFGAIVGTITHSTAHNIIFPAGTRFGLILGESLNVERRDLRS